MRWAGHAASMGAIDAFKILIINVSREERNWRTGIRVEGCAYY
jgi:hypothetical protein